MGNFLSNMAALYRSFYSYASLKKRFDPFSEMVSRDSVRLKVRNVQNYRNENREVHIFSAVFNEVKYI